MGMHTRLAAFGSAASAVKRNQHAPNSLFNTPATSRTFGYARTVTLVDCVPTRQGLYLYGL